MRGEFISVWSETWREIWLPLIAAPLGENDEGLPDDIFCELYREFAKALKAQPSVEALADIIDNPVQSRETFEHTRAEDIAGERSLVGFFEAVHEMLEEFENPGDDALSNRYFNLLVAFVEKFSLRYDLRRPCILCPTLPGLVTSLVQHMRSTSQADAHLAKLSHEFEEALRDLRHGRTEARIKACLSKQYILIEGIANVRGGTTGETLGQRCSHASWPHPTLRTAAGNIYGFRSNYPGLGHSGNPMSVLRDVDDRELVGVSCMLLGVVPYVDSTVNLASLYGDQASPTASGRLRSGDSSQVRKASPLLHRLRSMITRAFERR
ncbi:MAG: hypothetical protein ACREJ5_15595 [Geminicoccaceae bacterium]